MNVTFKDLHKWKLNSLSSPCDQVYVSNKNTVASGTYNYYYYNFIPVYLEKHIVQSQGADGSQLFDTLLLTERCICGWDTTGVNSLLIDIWKVSEKASMVPVNDFNKRARPSCQVRARNTDTVQH